MTTSHDPQHSHWGPRHHQGLPGWLQEPPCFCALFPLPTPNPLYSLHSSETDPLQHISHLIPLLRTLQWLPNSEKGSTVFTTLCELSPPPSTPPWAPLLFPFVPLLHTYQSVCHQVNKRSQPQAFAFAVSPPDGLFWHKSIHTVSPHIFFRSLLKCRLNQRGFSRTTLLKTTPYFLPASLFSMTVTSTTDPLRFMRLLLYCLPHENFNSTATTILVRFLHCLAPSAW